MNATLPETRTENARNYSGDKELTDRWQVVTYRDGKFRVVVDCRCWMGRSSSSSVVYSSIWVHGPDVWYSGRGKAGGGGYHKASAAVDSAIESAGITLDQSIHGVGDGAIMEALEAIAEALGYDTFTIV